MYIRPKQFSLNKLVGIDRGINFGVVTYDSKYKLTG